MYKENGVCILESEREELYVLLVGMESRLQGKLVDLKLRLERDLYDDHSIAQMETLVCQAGENFESE